MNRVLIVDDKEENLYYLQVLLTGHGYVVDCARHGGEALDKARQTPPDLVISDLLMPVMDGYMMLHQWKADEELKAIPFIVYTATYIEDEDEELALQMGADAFIRKPAEPEDFLARMHEVLKEPVVAGPPLAPQSSALDEKALLKLYSETLVRKLEEKSCQLEETNRALQRDIDERKAAVEELRQKDALIRIAGRITRIAGWAVEVPSRQISWSDELYDILEYPRGVTPPLEESLALYPEAWHKIISAALEECASHGTPFDVEAQINTSKGQLLWVRVCGEAQRNSAGVIDRVQGAFQDISQRKQSEAELRERENELSTLIEAMPQIVWISRPNGWRTHFNQKWFDFTGLTLEESLGHGWNPPLHPEDRLHAAKLWQQATQSGESYEIEYRLRRADGEYRWMLDRALPLRDTLGRIVKWLGTCTDIHDLKQAKEAAQRSENEQRELAAQLAAERARLIAAQSVAKVGSWETDLNTLKVHWSDETFRIFETDPQNFSPTHQNFLQYVHPDDRARVDGAFMSSLRAGMTHALEHRILLPDGHVKCLEEHWQVFQDEQGVAVRAIGTCQDITERRQAEEQRDRFFTLSVDLLCVAGIDGRFRRVNPAFFETLGYTEAELTAQPFLEFVHPDDRAATQQMIEALADGEAVTRFENRYRTSEGEWRWLEWRSVTVLEEGLVYAAARDVTERKQVETTLRRMRDELEHRVQERTSELNQAYQALKEEETRQKQVMTALAESEERFRLLVERVQDYAILMVDADGRVLTWNTGAQHLQGYPADEIVGQHFSCFHTAKDCADGIPEQLLRMAAEQGHSQNEGWRVRKDGSPFWATVDVTALRGDEGELRGFAKIMRDITERRNIEAALREAKEQADSANQAKSEFLSRMSHELRTPLNAILGFGQLLDTPEIGTAQQERVHYILRAGRHLLDLINEVLDIARIEAGRITLSLEPVQVRETVQEILSLVRPLAAEYGIKLNDDIVALSGTDYILADRQRIKQVLLNLYSNAIKYNRPHGSVHITWERVGEQVRINVTDTGIGISQEAQEKLFIPFMRLGAEQIHIEGTGLGLALTLNLVHAMGGTMGVESEVGVGTTFWFQLPLATAPVSSAFTRPVEGIRLDSVAIAESDKPCTILYIEDNLSNFQLIEDIIEGQASYELISAMQGRIGLELAQKHSPDLILLDLHLPDMTGDQVLARLQADPATVDIPVIVLSAVASQNEIRRLLFAGARAYLTKPLDIPLFLDTLSNTLQVHKRKA